MKYAAFISYRHGGIDEQVAMKIHKELERYRIPRKIAKRIGRKSIGKVFRDVEELKAASNLSEIIREALRETEWLIVVCTRRFKDSIWCMEEVEYFTEIRGRERIIVVLVEGEPDESFPEILTQIEENGVIKKIEPLAVDVRDDSQSQIVKNVKNEKLRFLADMLELDYDDLRQRQRERRRKKIIAIVSTAIAGLGIFGGVVTYKNIQLGVAYDKLGDSMKQTLRGQSYYLSEYANEAYNDGDRTTSALLALEALPEDISEPERPFVESVMNSLTQATGIYDFSSGYQPYKLFSLDDEAYDTKVEISDDEKLILIEKYVYASQNVLKREVYVYSIDNNKVLCSYELSSLSKSFYSAQIRCSTLLSDNRTLVYLGEDGTKAVDVYTGESKFSAEVGSELIASEDQTTLAIADYDKGYLYVYDNEGTQLLACNLGTDANYSLNCISQDNSSLAMSVNTTTAEGILLLNLSDGQSSFINQDGGCDHVKYYSDHKISFIRTDNQAGVKHIVIYDIDKASEVYLCDTKWNINDYCITNHKSCVYYQDKTLYDIDVKTGDVKWKHKFSDSISAISSYNDIVGVTCKDGSSYFYDTDSHKMINSVTGNGETYYMQNMSNKYACMRDYWGQNIRIYSNDNLSSKSAESVDLSGYGVNIPDKWYTCSNAGGEFMIGTVSGSTRKISVFDNNLNLLNNINLTDLDYTGFDNLSIDMNDNNYISIQDYDYGETKHIDVKSLKKTFSYDEANYYFYNEDASKIYVAKDNKIVEYNAAGGSSKASYDIPDGYDRGAIVDDYIVFSNDKVIYIKGIESDYEKKIEDAELYTFNQKRQLVFYRNAEGTEWYVYSIADHKVVCKGESGNYTSTSFLGNNKYFLNDYNSVYDMDTWKKVLDLSDISNGVYGVQTTDDLPYFVVWYQNSDSKTNTLSGESNTAYLYNKTDTSEIIGVVPNYVTTTSDGQIVVFDGNHTLYKTKLYTIKQIISEARDYVGDATLSDTQKAKYHLFDE